MPYQILYVESLTTKVTKLGVGAFGNWWSLSIKFLCCSFESPASRVTSGETQNFTRWVFIWGNGLLGDVSLKGMFLSPILTTLWVHIKVNKFSLSIVLPSSGLPHERPRNRELNDCGLSSLKPWAQINYCSPKLLISQWSSHNYHRKSFFHETGSTHERFFLWRTPESSLAFASTWRCSGKA